MTHSDHHTTPENDGSLSHLRIWSAIDALALRQGMSASGLAKRAGLDATTFNRSKRQTAGGRLRWPSTESIAKILDATGANVEEFLGLGDQAAGERRLQACRLPQVTEDTDLFDDSGLPTGDAWRQIDFPMIADDKAYAIEINGDALAPLYRDGDFVIVSPAAPVRSGDRVAVRTKQGETLLAQFKARERRVIEIRSLTPAEVDRMLAEDDIASIARIVWASQ